jgi:hypothetical protein
MLREVKAPQTTLLYGNAWDLASTLEPESVELNEAYKPF